MPQNTLETLLIDIAVDTAELKANLREATKELNSLKATVEQGQKSFLEMAASFATGTIAGKALVGVFTLGASSIKSLVSGGINLLVGTVRTAVSVVKGLGSALFSVAKTAGGVALSGFRFLVGAIGRFISFARQAASSNEQVMISFTTMLGSASKAANFLKDLREFAKITPFNKSEVEEVAKGLLAVGIQTEDILPDLRAIGDVAAGLSVPVSRLAIAFKQVFTAGRLRGEEIRQFTEAGVPLLRVLADTLGVTTGEVRELASQGKISFEQVRDAFREMAGEGGRFFNLMEAQNQSLQGRFSNLEDSVGIIATQIGGLFIEPMKKWLNATIETVEQIEQWLEELQGTPELQAFQDAISAIFDAVQDIGQTAFNALKEAIKNALGPAVTDAESLKDTLIKAFIAVEFGAKNWRDVLGVAIDFVQLKWITFSEDVKFFFTTKLPALFSIFKGFVDGFIDGIKNAVQSTIDAFGITGKVAMAVLGISIDQILSGLGGASASLGKDLNEIGKGVESALAMQRRQTPEERALAAQLNESSAALSDDFQEFLKKRLEELNLAAKDAEEEAATTTSGETAKKMSEQIKPALGGARGSAEAIDSIIRSVNRDRNTLQQRQLSAEEATAENTEAIAESLQGGSNVQVGGFFGGLGE